MKKYARILVPVSLALGAFSAQAAPVNNEIGDVDFQRPAVHARADAQSTRAEPQYILRDNQTAAVPNPGFAKGPSRSREDVRIEARQPALPIVGYNA